MAIMKAQDYLSGIPLKLQSDMVVASILESRAMHNRGFIMPRNLLDASLFTGHMIGASWMHKQLQPTLERKERQIYALHDLLKERDKELAELKSSFPMTVWSFLTLLCFRKRVVK